MGLDMFLYKVEKTNELKIGQHLDKEERLRLSEKITFFNERDFKYMPETIKQNAVKIKAENEYFDSEKIAKAICKKSGVLYEKKFAASAHCAFMSGDEVEYVLGDGELSDLKLTMKDPSKEGFTKIDTEIEYAVILKEADYQRKGLNARGWTLMACDNCEYTDDFGAVKKMVKEGGLSETFISNWEEGKTVFHPWW